MYQVSEIFDTFACCKYMLYIDILLIFASINKS